VFDTTLSGSVVVTPPLKYKAAELNATSNSVTGRTQIQIDVNPDLDAQPPLQSLCIDNILVNETAASSRTFVTTSGQRKIKFTLPSTVAGSSACADLPEEYARIVNIADGKQTNIIARNQLSYQAIKGGKAESTTIRRYDAASPVISKIDSEGRGVATIAWSGPTSFTAYEPQNCGIEFESLSKCANGKHFTEATLSNKKVISIQYDPTTSLPDDELVISDVSENDLFGGIIKAPNGAISLTDCGSCGGGSGAGKLLQNPINISLKSKTGHVSLIKRAEISSVIAKSSVDGEHIKQGAMKALVSNSPFVVVPTTYNVNPQGDYVFTSSINSAVGQYVLLDTAVTPNFPAASGTGNGLIRTGGESNQNNFGIFAAIILGFGAAVGAGFKVFKKR
jgi:hypothetical protein